MGATEVAAADEQALAGDEDAGAVGDDVRVRLPVGLDGGDVHPLPRQSVHARGQRRRRRRAVGGAREGDEPARGDHDRSDAGAEPGLERRGVGGGERDTAVGRPPRRGLHHVAGVDPTGHDDRRAGGGDTRGAAKSVDSPIGSCVRLPRVGGADRHDRLAATRSRRGCSRRPAVRPLMLPVHSTVPRRPNGSTRVPERDTVDGADHTAGRCAPTSSSMDPATASSVPSQTPSSRRRRGAGSERGLLGHRRPVLALGRVPHGDRGALAGPCLGGADQQVAAPVRRGEQLACRRRRFGIRGRLDHRCERPLAAARSSSSSSPPSCSSSTPRWWAAARSSAAV